VWFWFGACGCVTWSSALPHTSGVVYRGNPTSTATSPASTVAIDSTPACHGYGDALSPNSEWPRRLPTPKTPAAIVRYAMMMAGLGPRGIRCLSIIVLRLVLGSVPAASSLTGNMNPTRTVGKVTYLQWPLLTPSSHVRLGRMVFGPFGTSKAPGPTVNLLHCLPCTRCCHGYDRRNT
jgi:hypothetical protein